MTKQNTGLCVVLCCDDPCAWNFMSLNFAARSQSYNIQSGFLHSSIGTSPNSASHVRKKTERYCSHFLRTVKFLQHGGWIYSRITVRILCSVIGLMSDNSILNYVSRSHIFEGEVVGLFAITFNLLRFHLAGLCLSAKVTMQKVCTTLISTIQPLNCYSSQALGTVSMLFPEAAVEEELVFISQGGLQSPSLRIIES